MSLNMRRLTTERSAGIILFMLLFAVALRVAVDNDLWWHLRLGQHILDTSEPLYLDHFSFTRDGNLHYNHSALAQVAMVIIWNLAGLSGMSLFTALMALTAMFFAYRSSTGNVYMRGFLLVLAAATAASFWSPRPQMFSFLLAAVLLWRLHRYRRGLGDGLRWLLPLMWLWGNAHGGYIIGYFLIGAIIVGDLLNTIAATGQTVMQPRAIRKLVIVALASVPLLVINPLGTRIYTIPWQTLSLPELRRYIVEWQPLDLGQPMAWLFLLLFALVIAAARASHRRFDFCEIFLIGGTAVMALTAARNLSIFAIAALPIATFHLDEILRRKGWTIPHREFETPRRLALNILLIGLVAVGVLLYVRHIVAEDVVNDAMSSRLPVSAVEYLNDMALEGNMFNSYNWGGYLMFYAPQIPVFIDGRTDLYAGFLNDYYRIATAASGWKTELDNWQISFALIETDSGLSEALASAPGWSTAYQDALTSIFVRQTQTHDDGRQG